VIENPMVLNNRHDSCKKDFDEYCTIFEGEIYHGMKYYQIGDVLICEECEHRVLEIALVRVAGE
jgi:hypothetical protein